MPKLLDVPLQKNIGAINTESFQDIANAGDQRRAAVLTQASDAKQEEIVQKTKDIPFGQAWGAAVDTEMAGTAIANYLTPYGNRVDPEYVYDPEHVTAVGKQFDNDKEAQQAFYAESLKAQSQGDVELIANSVRDYRRKQQILQEAGSTGIAASVLASLADPMNVAFGAAGYAGGLVRGVASGLGVGSKLVNSMNKIKTLSRGGAAVEATAASKAAGVAVGATEVATAAKAVGAAEVSSVGMAASEVAQGASKASQVMTGAATAFTTNMATEAILQNTQPLREIDDAYATAALSLILGGAGGHFAAKQTRENKILNEMMDRRSMAAGKRVEAYATAGFDASPKAGDDVSFGSGAAAREGKVHSFTDDHVIIVDSAGNSHTVPHGMIRPSKGATSADTPKAPDVGVAPVKVHGTPDVTPQGVQPTQAMDTPAAPTAVDPVTAPASTGPYAGTIKANPDGTPANIPVKNGIQNIDGPSAAQQVDGVALHPDIDPRPYSESAGAAVEAPLLRTLHEMVHGDSQIAQDLLDACAKR